MRPEFLRTQLALLLQQTFGDFEIVISDNDPAGSGKAIAESFNDGRIRYYHNAVNLGMIKSFNKSIERSLTDYIVMVTDDDPVDKIFLNEMYILSKANPGFSVYGGFKRKYSKPGSVEIIDANYFAAEILHPDKTLNLLWSSCVLEKDSVIRIGMIPDYGSPHLADHALLALTGNEKGGVLVNRMFSSLTSHNTNFSKLNLDYYYISCEGFYNVMTSRLCNNNFAKKAVRLHLENWLIANVFTLKKFYTIVKPDKEKILVVESFANKIIELPFIGAVVKIKYFLKQLIFKVKVAIGMLK